MLKTGNDGIGKMFIGDDAIAKAYLGDDLVYSAEPPIDYSSTEGWKFDIRYNSGGETAASGCCVTKYYDVNPGDVIRYIVGNPTPNLGIFYMTNQSTKKFLQWATKQNTYAYNVTMPSDCVQVSFSMATSRLDYNYLLNTTTGKYLYKGKLVS